MFRDTAFTTARAKPATRAQDHQSSMEVSSRQNVP